MRLLSKPQAWLWVALALAPLSVDASPAARSSVTSLRQLAARATQRQTWPILLRYASSTSDPELRGQAYFVLGFREYEAGEFFQAAKALREAVLTGFSLADFAEYYFALVEENEGQPTQVVEALEGFSARHPQSPLRLQALERFAKALDETGQPERAIPLLLSEPRTRETPALALLLGQAYFHDGKLDESARAFQHVYYTFPTATESKVAFDALRELETKLGPSYPRAGEDLRTRRAEIFFDKSRIREAVDEYEKLLRELPQSPWAARWKLGRARCLLRLKRFVEAAQALASPVTTDPQVDAERLETLVEVAARQDDVELMRRELGELRRLYPNSPAHASGLTSAARYFWREGKWEDAAPYDQLLAQRFPETELGQEGNWRQAWFHYLSRRNDEARKALLEHLVRYPDSPHGPAAIYWLGRLAEEDKAMAEARALYEFLNKRFVHTYYAVKALRQLKPFPSSADGGSEESGPVSAVLATIMQKLPPLGSPSIRPCAPSKPSDSLRPYSTLRGLNLDGLAEEYLKAELSNHPDDPALLLSFSRLEAELGNYIVAVRTARKLVPNFSDYDYGDLPKEIWDLLFPQAYATLVKRQARANGVDPYLVMAVIRQESAFNPRATSSANARGLMQILPQTASRARRRRASVARRLYDPSYNVSLGCRYLRRLIKTYNGDLEVALAAYNAGEPRVRDWLEGHQFREPAEFLETVPFRETRFYVEAVLRDAEIYRRLMTSSVKFRKCG